MKDKREYPNGGTGGILHRKQSALTDRYATRNVVGRPGGHKKNETSARGSLIATRTTRL